MSGPVNAALAGTPWLTTGGIPTGALVRSAVFALDLTGARSSAFRGRRSGLAALISPASSTSHLWVETDDFRAWDFVLGVGNWRGEIAADWAVKLTMNGAAATLKTTRWLTRDDVLVHGSHHDALRDELLRALALGRQADADGEADISATSLKLSQPFQAAAAAPFDLRFSIMTVLDEAASRERLTLSGYRVLDDSPRAIRWGLGLPGNQATDHVTISFEPGELRGTAQVASAGQAGRRIAAHALRSFVDRALFLIRARDGSASYQGPEDWRPSS